MIGFDNIEGLMQTEVSRKEFLKYIGIALLALIGVTNMMQNLSKALDHKQTGRNVSKAGYGSTPYGR